jgi:SAM-dependent methyltransferase
MRVYDPIAQSAYDYFTTGTNVPITIHCDDFDDDEVFPSYFFRTYPHMPYIEQQAMERAFGSVLDVGAGVGCHSVHLQNTGHTVTALEKSELCCEILHQRKLNQVVCADIYQYEGQCFDTILLLMNGTGIAGTLEHLTAFLVKIKSLLAERGQILIDSSDLMYLFLDEDGSACFDLGADHYYGELRYQTEYNNRKGESFPWLYVDKDILMEHADAAGLVVEEIIDGEHYDYLAVLRRG